MSVGEGSRGRLDGDGRGRTGREGRGRGRDLWGLKKEPLGHRVNPASARANHGGCSTPLYRPAAPLVLPLLERDGCATSPPRPPFKDSHLLVNVPSPHPPTDQAVAMSMAPKDADPLLRFFDVCPAYAQHDEFTERWMSGWMQVRLGQWW